MARATTEYRCENCGYKSPKWLGRCPSCSSWDTMLEERIEKRSPGKRRSKEALKPVKLRDIDKRDSQLIPSGISELDRVLGGGFTSNSTILISGDPGIGKSTLLLQALQTISGRGDICLYVTGEESPRQIKIRADRLKKNPEDLFILAETDIENICKAIEEISPSIITIDSIQTVQHPDIPSPPGSVNQIRECTAKLVEVAKEKDTCVFFVGHVTKDGSIAGPMTLEHMVDTVVYFEGEARSQYRILRSVKNRFGTTNEIGVFEMTQKGLEQVKNPSGIFLSQTCERSPGSIAMANMEGTRPFLIEVQALCSQSNYSVPTRIATGIDRNRTLLLIAIAEKKLGLKMSNQDVFINITGGVRINERAGDLPIMCAMISSLMNKTMPKKSFIFGEIGLTGEIRPSKMPALRIAEGEKLGFERCILPADNLSSVKLPHSKLELIGVQSVDEIMTKVFNL